MSMSGLPISGRIACTLCHIGSVDFGRTVRTEGDWRITANPLAWGNPNAEIVVLGFSKGPNQLSALASKVHNEFPMPEAELTLGKSLRVSNSFRQEAMRITIVKFLT